MEIHGRGDNSCSGIFMMDLQTPEFTSDSGAVKAFKNQDHGDIGFMVPSLNHKIASSFREMWWLTAMEPRFLPPPATGHQVLMKSKRSALSWSLCVSAKPWGAPG